jgi:hypothetical protein
MNFHSSVWIHHIFMNEFYGNFSYKSNIDLKKNIYYEKQRIPRRDQWNINVKYKLPLLIMYGK